MVRHHGRLGPQPVHNGINGLVRPVGNSLKAGNFHRALFLTLALVHMTYGTQAICQVMPSVDVRCLARRKPYQGGGHEYDEHTHHANRPIDVIVATRRELAPPTVSSADTLIAVLPQLEGREKRDENARQYMPNAERATRAVAKDQ